MYAIESFSTLNKMLAENEDVIIYHAPGPLAFRTEAPGGVTEAVCDAKALQFNQFDAGYCVMFRRGHEVLRAWMECLSAESFRALLSVYRQMRA